MEQPGLRWSGPGYFDTNAGAAPLEDDFAHWDWCRAPLGHGTAILYNVTRRGGDELAVALHADPSGVVRDMPTAPGLRLPRTRWGVERPTRAERGTHSLSKGDGRTVPSLTQSTSLSVMV